MKPGHVLLLALVPVTLGACSDPPSAAPEAAAYIAVARGATGTCDQSATHGLYTMPQDQRVYDNLNCNLENGCKPDAIVAVDGDADTLVNCSVSPSGSVFTVSGSFTYQGTSITVSGQIGPTGGDVNMTHYYRIQGVGLSGSCTLSILPNRGAIAGGRIWAHFTCPDFTDESAPGGRDCSAEGAFLFQKCSGG